MKYIICAEIGCNWYYPDKFNDKFGKPESIELMIREAAEAGVDAVKFQYYSTKEIMAYEAKQPSTQYTPEIYKTIKQTELDWADLAAIRETCDDNALQMIVTPFLRPDRVNDLEMVDALKIRHRDRENMELIGACLDTGKRTYVSQTRAYMERIVEFSDQYRQIFCIPRYPARWSDIDLQLNDLTGIMAFNGYSNHIPSVGAVLALSAIPFLGTPVYPDWYLEVHVKEWNTKPVDDAVSLDYEQLRVIVDVLREWEQGRDKVTIRPLEPVIF